MIEFIQEGKFPMQKKIFTLFILLAFTLPAVSFAAGFDFINVKLDPKTPGENTDVTVSIESFAVNLDASEIIWYVDKDPIKQGVGVKSLQVHTGNFGQTLHVKAVILSNLGKRVEKEIAIVPSEIDLLWEAKTYTPPFYKGKALPTYKSLVKVTAIPRYGKSMSDPKDFMYSWKYNKTLSVGQGLGKNSALIQMGYPGTPVPVSVDITLPAADWVGGQKTTSINGGEALVRFYEQAPLLGINFHRSLLSGGVSDGNQYTIKAVPYFFSTEDIVDHQLVYTWRVNNSNVVTDIDPTVLRITKQGTGLEQFDVHLRIQTPRHLLQEGSADAVISLNEEKK